jgi:hypothetical protein
MAVLLIAIVITLLSSGCTTTVRIQSPSVVRAFDGLPDPAHLVNADGVTRIERGTPLTLIVSKNTEKLLSMIDACRDLTLKETSRPSSLLLGLTGITPREVNANLDIGQTYVAKVANALQKRFGKVGFANSIQEAQTAANGAANGGAIALLDATGGSTRCAQSPGGDIGLVLDRIDTQIVFLSPAMKRICETRSSARWRDAEFKGVLSLFGSSLERHREYFDWLGDSLEQQLGKCVS